MLGCPGEPFHLSPVEPLERPSLEFTVDGATRDVPGRASFFVDQRYGRSFTLRLKRDRSCLIFLFLVWRHRNRPICNGRVGWLVPQDGPRLALYLLLNKS